MGCRWVAGIPAELRSREEDVVVVIYNGTRTMYDRIGFEYDRPKGPGNRVMCTFEPATPEPPTD